VDFYSEIFGVCTVFFGMDGTGYAGGQHGCGGGKSGAQPWEVHGVEVNGSLQVSFVFRPAPKPKACQMGDLI
jgi:hypothetical protein